MTDFDVQIKGGTIVDGTGLPKFKGDLWIKDGKIAQIGGRSKGKAAKVIDAEGAIVAPGFIDLHTHYDAQIRWDPYCTSSGWHGVTTVLLGNCGFGFAPCKPDFRERSMLTMTRAEAIPFDSMKEGMLPHWDWETIPEYMDSLDRAPKGVNAMHYMPTAALMTYVMGLEAAKTRRATPVEVKEMQRLLHEGMDAGLCGFSIQRMGENCFQTDFDGTPMVTDTMSDDEIFALADVLRERNEGCIQISQAVNGAVGDYRDLEFQRLLAERAQRPILHNAVVIEARDLDLHRQRLKWLNDCNEAGLQVYGIAGTIRAAFVFTFEGWSFYDSEEPWRDALICSDEEKKQHFADPEMRVRLKAVTDEPSEVFQSILDSTGGHPSTLMFYGGTGGKAHLKELLGRTVAEIAELQGKHYLDAMLDLALETNLKAEFLGGAAAPESPIELLSELILNSPYTMPGLSDGGAHTKFVTAGGFPTDFLEWMVRDEKVISLEDAHYRLSALPARSVGIKDRGMLLEGWAADIVVYDQAELAKDPTWFGEVAYDQPGGEWRRIQRAKGYRAILVNGVETFNDGVCTGDTPGQLLRNGTG